MSEEKKIDKSNELTDDDLNGVAGGFSLKPIVSGREGVLIQTDTFPRTEFVPIDGLKSKF